MEMSRKRPALGMPRRRAMLLPWRASWLVVVVVMPARSSALVAASWLRLRLGREPGASGWLGWMMQPTAEWGGGGWQNPR